MTKYRDYGSNVQVGDLPEKKDAHKRTIRGHLYTYVLGATTKRRAMQEVNYYNKMGRYHVILVRGGPAEWSWQCWARLKRGKNNRTYRKKR